MHNERCTSGSEGGPEKPGGRKADRALRSDPTVMAALFSPTAALVACAATAWAVAAAFPASAGGGERPGPADQARGLVESVTGTEPPDDLDAWLRTVVGPALERAGSESLPEASPATPALPPLLHADPAPPQPRTSPTAEVLVFTSLAVPAASWQAAARDAARAGATLVLRGVVQESLPATARRVAARLGGADAGVAIDPRLFRLFGVTRVPAVVVVPGGVPPCRSRGCAADPPPPHDRVSGNLSLAAALEAIAAEGTVARAAARRRLDRLRSGP